MEILPRIKPMVNIAKHPGSNANELPIKNVPATPVAPTAALVDDEDENVDPVKSGSRSIIRDNYIIIFIFAAIFVVLVIIVVWLVIKNDRYLNWLRGDKYPTTFNAKPKVSKNPHSDIMKNTSSDELKMYANLDTNKPDSPTATENYNLSREEPHKKVTFSNPIEKIGIISIEEESDNEETETDDGKSGKAGDGKSGKTSDDIVQNTGSDSLMESNLNDKLKAIVDSSSDNTENTIEKIVDREIASIEAEQRKEVEQIDKKSGSVIQKFNTSDEIYDAGFDYDSVIACCKGKTQTHKNFKWRFAK